MNSRSSFQVSRSSSVDSHCPVPSPAMNAAPRPVVSTISGRSTGTPRRSAWNWQSKSLAAAPPSTISELSAVGSVSVTSRTSKAMASRVARTRWARVVPRVRPRIVPRACGSQCGAPSPVSAGTNTTPSVLSTEAAISAVLPAESMIPSPSRSHWIAAPVTKIEPSSA